MRILSLKGSNGKTYQYLINNRVSATNTQPEILMPFMNNQLKQIMNIKLASHKETAARHYQFKIIGEFFVSSQISLVEHKSRLKSVHDLLDEHFVSKGMDRDCSLELYLKENTFVNQFAKQEIFKKMDKSVPGDLLKKFALSCVNNMDEYMFFRTNFINTFGMENFFSYLISNGKVIRAKNLIFIRNDA